MDRLWFARNFLIVTWIAAASGLSLVFFDSTLGPREPLNRARASLRVLGLSNLSFVPAGSIWRNPDALSPCVDLRFSPALPGIVPDSADLVLGSPEALDE